MVGVKETEVIAKIECDVLFHGIVSHISMEYPEEKDWALTWEDIHKESNDSWCMVELADNTIMDVQIFGTDDSEGLNTPLRMQGNVMRYNGVNCDHTSIWCNNENFFNINVYLKKGTKVLVR